MAWTKGEKRRLKATFTADAAGGNPTQPVKVNAMNPDGTVAIDDQTATPESETEFYYDFTPTVAGKYLHYSFRSADGALKTRQVEIVEDKSKN